MQKEQYLSELLGRLCDKSDFTFAPGFDSTKTISWKAMREAEKLDDPQFVPLLQKIIEREDDQRKRDRAYFVLGQVALNIADASAAAFFIQRIPFETDAGSLSSMLLNLKPLYKPGGTDVEPLLKLLSSSEEEVKLAAIQALSHCEDAAAEDALIKIVSAPGSNIELLYGLEALAHSGSAKAVSAIQKHVNNKDKEVRSLASAALTAIKGRRK